MRQRDPKDRTFAPDGIGHDVLRCLLLRSVAALEHDAEFRELLQMAGLRELLRRSREHTKTPMSGGIVNCSKRSRAIRASIPKFLPRCSITSARAV